MPAAIRESIFPIFVKIEFDSNKKRSESPQMNMPSAVLNFI